MYKQKKAEMNRYLFVCFNLNAGFIKPNNQSPAINQQQAINVDRKAILVKAT